MAGPVDRTWTEYSSDQTESGSDRRIPTSDHCIVDKQHTLSCVTVSVG